VPVKLTEAEVEVLFIKCKNEDVTLTVDLINNKVIAGDTSYNFSLDDFHQYCLEQGIDSVGWTLNKLDIIKAFEARLPVWQ
jgi:3-isopropylmalate/(R)-2-methylmalate dehydratase small subunit